MCSSWIACCGRRKNFLRCFDGLRGVEGAAPYNIDGLRGVVGAAPYNIDGLRGVVGAAPYRMKGKEVFGWIL